MNIIAFLILGLIAGWIASAVMKTGHTSVLGDMVMGTVGALIGGFVMNMIGASGVNGLNLYSILVAALGAILLIWIGRQVRL